MTGKDEISEFEFQLLRNTIVVIRCASRAAWRLLLEVDIGRILIRSFFDWIGWIIRLMCWSSLPVLGMLLRE